MDLTKSKRASKTIRGAIVAGIVTIINLTGLVQIDDVLQQQILEAIISIIQAIGLIMVVVGRFTAKKAIK